jgi:hypothetical protein
MDRLSFSLPLPFPSFIFFSVPETFELPFPAHSARADNSALSTLPRRAVHASRKNREARARVLADAKFTPGSTATD